MININQQMPSDVLAQLAARVRARRKELHLTQAQMARKAGMSLGSYKRFERQHQIALESLVKIAFALGCESDFDALFARRAYASIEDVIRDAR